MLGGQFEWFDEREGIQGCLTKKKKIGEDEN